MKRLRFQIVRTTLMGGCDAALVGPGEDPMEALAEAVVDFLSTEVEVEFAGTRATLAMLMDPDHWAEDWEAAGLDDPAAFVAALVDSDPPEEVPQA